MIMKDLTRIVSEKLDGKVSQKVVAEVYNAFIEALYEETEQETTMSIQIPKIGILKTSVKEAYTAKNPMNGEPVEVPTSRQCRITICKALKDKVKEGLEVKKPAKKAAKKAPAKAEAKAPAKKAPAKKVAKKAKK